MRPIWKGAINFGLIHIPIKLYKASQEQRFHFRYLHKDNLCPIKYVRICKYTGKEVDYKDIVKGYEYEKGDYVVLNDEDFKKINPEKYQAVNISKFVDESEIDSKFIEKPYYLEPDENTENHYILLREALKKTKKVGIGKFMLRNKEHLARVRSLKPKEEAPVSTPLHWEEVKKGLDIKKFNIKTIHKRIEKEGDLWQNVLKESNGIREIIPKIEKMFK